VVADDGARLWHVVEGDGLPVVLCHGGPGLWDILGPVAAMITDLVRAIRWEQRGSGRSDRRGPYTLERFVADLDQLRDHLGFERWIVGGHSWGATLALQYALALPDRVSGLVYVSGVGLGRAWNSAYHAEADRRLSTPERTRRDELRALPSRTIEQEREFRVLSWAPDFGDRTQARRRADGLALAPFDINFESNSALNAETKTWDEDDLIARCAALDVPTLIVHGALDPRPVWALDTHVASLPRCSVAIIAHCGHLPWLEDPAATRSVLRRFLKQLA